MELEIGEKYCPQCEQRKLVSDFPRNAGSPDGLHAWCKVCKNARAREQYAEDEHVRERCHYAHKRRTYGLTPEQLSEMLEQQGGGCGICGGPPRSVRGWSIDHDHDTGRVRGILCVPCNSALGALGDDIASIRRVLAYLLKAEE